MKNDILTLVLFIIMVEFFSLLLVTLEDEPQTLKTEKVGGCYE